MSRTKATRTKFEIVSDYVDPKAPRNYATVVLSDGTRIAATDGFGLIAAPDSRAPGTYRASGETTAIQAPQFAAIVDAAVAGPGREVQPAEMLREVLGVSSKKPLFVGVGRNAPDVVILTAKPCAHGFGERVWFSASALKYWFADMSADALIRIQDETLVAQDGEYVRLLAAVRAGD